MICQPNDWKVKIYKQEEGGYNIKHEVRNTKIDVFKIIKYGGYFINIIELEYFVHKNSKIKG